MRNPWAREYARTPDRYIWGTAASEFAKEIVRLLRAGSRVLDLGCGEGRDSVYFAACGFDVTALDVSADGLKKATRLADERDVKVRWLCRSMVDAPVAGRFDLVYSCGSIHHVRKEARSRLFRRLKVLTRPGGINAHIVFTDLKVYREKGEEIDYFRRGELRGCYDDWPVLTHETGQISCAQDGIRHSHSTERIVCSRPEAGSNPTGVPLFSA
jgi:tellurite methyltransferase